MKRVEIFIKYIGYIAIAITLGCVSDSNENDFVEKITPSIIPILLTLTVLNTTLTNLLLNELLKFKEKYNYKIDEVVGELKRNSIIELGLITFTFVVLILEGEFCNIIPLVIPYKGVFINALVVFDILYFVYVIYDNTEGWYKLIKQNNSNL